MGRKFETAAVEVVYAYAVASVLIWGVAAGIVLLVGLPQVFVFPLLQVAALIAAAFFALKSGKALLLHYAERYYIEDGWVRIEGGLVSKYRTGFKLDNVRKTWVWFPPLFRIFGIGSVWVRTADCSSYWLRNLEEPYHVAEEILPTQDSEPVFRPSVG